MFISITIYTLNTFISVFFEIIVYAYLFIQNYPFYVGIVFFTAIFQFQDLF